MSLRRFTSLSVPATRTCQTVPTMMSGTKACSSSSLCAFTHSSIHTSYSSQTRHLTSTLFLRNSSSSSNRSGPGVTPPSPSRSSKSSTTSNSSNKDSKLDPDKIKGPGGLTMTQIGKLVQQSRARDLEHQQQQRSKPDTSSGNKRK
ncbi:MAG: hypothetical protein JOS17DRAFT_463659 [Linnemannia elongata]|nr:MAG: hypothetical protein JOS17DRAFT_463659 [Linnemannia elongata]